jgi:UDP-N-acetylmuramate dehydrogenase
MGVKAPTILDISNAVIRIRSSKLPDPKTLGNAGSFFKNPLVQKKITTELLKKHPKMPHYPIDEYFEKIPAGWLIEKLGLKGFKKGNVGIYEKQALILVNYGKASGNEILKLSKFVMDNVKECFNIDLDSEVNIIR